MAQISPEIRSLITKYFTEQNEIDPRVYSYYDVKRGLRNADGTGVLAGVTTISNVHGYVMNEGDKTPVEGKLYYRGHEIRDLVESVPADDCRGFERMCILLLSGSEASENGLKLFQKTIEPNRQFPETFVADYIIQPPTKNIMNLIERTISILYAFDPNDAEDRSFSHELNVAISLLSKLPRIMVLGHYAKESFYNNGSMIIHQQIEGQSTAETILSMLRPDRQFTTEEAKMLDIMLMLHAEHGGGNNSTFTCRCLTSAGTDPYSAYAGAVGSLKGSLHGGANIKVANMFDYFKENVSNWEDDGEVADMIGKIVRKEAFDQAGLVYGMGHAVYTLSDPRAEICRKFARNLAQGTEYEAEFAFLEKIAELAPEIITSTKGTSKAICPNIDMFSGLVYRMLGIPQDMFTPLFACARMAGWAAHRFEELTSGKRIMRPAYKSIDDRFDIKE